MDYANIGKHFLVGWPPPGKSPSVWQTRTYGGCPHCPYVVRILLYTIILLLSIMSILSTYYRLIYYDIIFTYICMRTT